MLTKHKQMKNFLDGNQTEIPEIALQCSTIKLQGQYSVRHFLFSNVGKAATVRARDAMLSIVLAV